MKVIARIASAIMISSSVNPRSLKGLVILAIEQDLGHIAFPRRYHAGQRVDQQRKLVPRPIFQVNDAALRPPDREEPDRCQPILDNFVLSRLDIQELHAG